MKEIDFEELEKILNENRADVSWARILGFYRKIRESKDMYERVKHIFSLVKALHKKGYMMDAECIKRLIEIEEADEE